jgi:hypothetical protein
MLKRVKSSGAAEISSLIKHQDIIYTSRLSANNFCYILQIAKQVNKIEIATYRQFPNPNLLLHAE